MLKDEYNKIITESGLLAKHNKHYDENFLLVNNDELLPVPKADELLQTPIVPPPAPESVVPGGRFRPRSRKSSKMSKTTHRGKSSKNVRSRKANKAKQLNRKH
jgi:hypothetical protein